MLQLIGRIVGGMETCKYTRMTALSRYSIRFIRLQLGTRPCPSSLAFSDGKNGAAEWLLRALASHDLCSDTVTQPS